MKTSFIVVEIDVINHTIAHILCFGFFVRFIRFSHLLKTKRIKSIPIKKEKIIEMLTNNAFFSVSVSVSFFNS